MERQGDEVHVETDDARGGSTPHIVRWILGVSLLLAIVLLSITWITGALSIGEAGTQATTTDRTADRAGDRGDDSDRSEAAPATGDVEPGRVEN